MGKDSVAMLNLAIRGNKANEALIEFNTNYIYYDGGLVHTVNLLVMAEVRSTDKVWLILNAMDPSQKNVTVPTPTHAG